MLQSGGTELNQEIRIKCKFKAIRVLVKKKKLEKSGEKLMIDSLTLS